MEFWTGFWKTWIWVCAILAGAALFFSAAISQGEANIPYILIGGIFIIVGAISLTERLRRRYSCETCELYGTLVCNRMYKQPNVVGRVR